MSYRPSTRPVEEQKPLYPKKKGTKKNDNSLNFLKGVGVCLFAVLTLWGAVAGIFAIIAFVRVGDVQSHIHPSVYCSFDQDGEMNLDFIGFNSTEHQILGWDKVVCKGIDVGNNSMEAITEGWYRIHATSRLKFAPNHTTEDWDVFRIRITVDGIPTDVYGESFFREKVNPGSFQVSKNGGSDAYIHRDIYLKKSQEVGLLIGAGYEITVNDSSAVLAFLQNQQTLGRRYAATRSTLIASFLQPLPNV